MDHWRCLTHFGFRDLALDNQSIGNEDQRCTLTTVMRPVRVMNMRKQDLLCHGTPVGSQATQPVPPSEGFTRNATDLVRTTNVWVVFDHNGKIKTLYPFLSPLP